MNSLTLHPGSDLGLGVWTHDDLHLFGEGSHFHLHHKFGAHPATLDGVRGVYFSVWAPNATYTAVVGDFNGWNRGDQPMLRIAEIGIWERFVPGVAPGSIYKYHIASRFHGYAVDKADPFAHASETPPHTGSVYRPWQYQWNDQHWMETRGPRQTVESPISIYEMHPGSWIRDPGDPGRWPTYRELAAKLPGYLRDEGFTHVELMPIMVHPLYRSWGYQVTGYFAPTARYGSPEDFMALVDALHQAEIGVVLDWVPSHFPSDEHGLGYFDGTHLYEHADPRKGFHPEWTSLIFNYDRGEIRSFLVSSAMFWLEQCHADGLRVDAVASMLYLDYARNPGEWVPNEYGGRDNIGAIEFLKRLNQACYGYFPNALMIAEEATSWGGTTRPVHEDGLGFGYKWDMGWMHDSLRYFKEDPLFRKGRHNDLTFRMLYAHTENFVLAISHDEVVYGKRSLLNRMPGDRWQQFANLRLFFAWMFAMPGKKHMFMGQEFGQWNEWNFETSLDWHLLNDPLHAGAARLYRDLNALYRSENALYQGDCQNGGFEWIDCDDAAESVVALLRRDTRSGDLMIIALNFTPIPRQARRVGSPEYGRYEVLLNSDAVDYGGSGQGDPGPIWTSPQGAQNRPFSLSLQLPPLGALFLRFRGAN
ncbi:MAG: 1,4-alpha-glucan branching protein GlgB [Leptospirales bacterium]|nr:1,4-alpha-glucan branching protein GlgB [Leptospirales bacterium]